VRESCYLVGPPGISAWHQFDDTAKTRISITLGHSPKVDHGEIPSMFPTFPAGLLRVFFFLFSLSMTPLLSQPPRLRRFSMQDTVHPAHAFSSTPSPSFSIYFCFFSH
ncbi:unnamed protein product, partial [Ectocarpus sp. 4 AP-2014]